MGRSRSPALGAWIRKNSVVAMPEPGRILANPATVLENSAFLAGDWLRPFRCSRVMGATQFAAGWSSAGAAGGESRHSGRQLVMEDS